MLTLRKGVSNLILSEIHLLAFLGGGRSLESGRLFAVRVYFKILESEGHLFEMGVYI